MLDYLYYSAEMYQQLHGLKPNLVYLNNNHYLSLQHQLEIQNQLTLIFGEFEIKIVLAPLLIHPSFARI